MFKMNKNLIGLATIAVALAGCQTAPVRFASDADIDIPGYGASREISGLPLYLKEADKLVHSLVAERGLIKSGIKDVDMVSNFVNQQLKTDAELRAAAKELGIKHFDESNIGSLSPELQLKLAKKFANTKVARSISEFDSFRAQVAKADATAGAEFGAKASSQKSLLTSTGFGERTAAHEAKGLKPSEIRRLAEQGNPELATEEGRKATSDLFVANKKVYLLSDGAEGGPLVTVSENTCLKELSPSEVEGYAQVIKGGADELEATTKVESNGRKICRNAAAVMKKGMIRAQQVIMKRVGDAADMAVNAMAKLPCNMADRRIATADESTGDSCK
jgi:hypothetical protein